MIRATDATFPFICVQAIGFCSAEEVAKTKPIYERAFARELRHISLTDARRSDHSARQRKIWADWTNASMAESERWTAATIVVLDSTILRGALTALNWLAPPKTPQYVAATIAEAIAIGRTTSQALGLPVEASTWSAIASFFEGGPSRVSL